MKILLSVLLRIAAFISIGIFAFFIGIAVAMGFDSGISWTAILVAIVYLIIFLPVIIVIFLPLELIINPRGLLKIWYIFVVTILSTVFLIMSIYDITYAISNSSIYKNLFSDKVCFTREINDSFDKNSGALLLYDKTNLVLRLFPGEKSCFTINNNRIFELRTVKCDKVKHELEPVMYEKTNIDELLNQSPYALNLKLSKMRNFTTVPSGKGDAKYEWIILPVNP
jgi:hypothetical protein